MMFRENVLIKLDRMHNMLLPHPQRIICIPSETWGSFEYNVQEQKILEIKF